MMKVDLEKCIGCGMCISDCFANDIKMIDGKASIRNITCFKCGHCIAVCPVNAVSTDEYNMDDVKEYNKDTFIVESENLLNFIKFRRTIRHFKNKKVEKEKILKIIEAGRFTETASNSQNVSYVVVENKIEELRKLTLESLNKIGKNLLETSNNKLYLKYAKMWMGMYNKYISSPKEEDNLFFHAPLLIIVVSESIVNGSLASGSMELLTNSLGLGALFSGFFVKAAESNNEIRDLLGLKKSQEIVSCMVIGYPDISFKRTVPRKTPEILFI